MGEQRKMKVLITGAKGFVGKNLSAHLRTLGDCELLEYDRDTAPELLDSYTADCDFVFHLAGVNRPQNPEEFMQGNCGFTETLLGSLHRHGNKAPIVVTSSIQAELDNPYGKSKKAGEELLQSYSRQTGAKELIYRLPNLFGKWCRPNYNSVVATFCHNLARGLPITVNDRDTVLSLVYIDDLLQELVQALHGKPTRQGDYCTVQTIHTVTLGQLADLLQGFGKSRQNLSIPDVGDPLTKKLYSTYLSYLPMQELSKRLDTHADGRGSFTEILHTPDRGQFSVNISHPGITKGEHWHHTKHEKFAVVSGNGIIRLRCIATGEVAEYTVSGSCIETIDIPPGCTHNIENTGESDMVTFMWCNECFNPEQPDTNYEKV